MVKAVAEMRQADYSKEPELGAIYQRLIKGREQFEEAMSDDIGAVMQISSLEVAMNHHTDHMMEISHNVAAATEVIFGAAAETSQVAGQVNEQHEELTNTIIKASEESEEVYKKIEAGQSELTNIKGLSEQTIEASKEMQKDMDKLLEVINLLLILIIINYMNLIPLKSSILRSARGT